MEYPFTTEQFFGVFADYNTSVWPAQILLNVAALSVAVLLYKGYRRADKAIALILAFFWLWIGIVYHWSFFAAVNPAAKLFGAAFVLEGLLLAYHGLRGRLAFLPDRSARSIVGLCLMAFGPIVYPIIGYLLGHAYPSSPTFGLPCPTVIFTLGVLLQAVRPPRHIVAIPFLWSLLGFSAAVSFGVKEDFALLVAGLIGLVWIGFRRAPDRSPEPLRAG